MGLFGPPDVEKLKAKRDINGLISALGYEKENKIAEGLIRQAAAKALGEIGDAHTVVIDRARLYQS